MENIENFEIVKAKEVFEKKTVDDILKEIKDIDCKKVAEEIIAWLMVNVESFVDNYVKVFQFPVVFEDAEEIAGAKKLQDLYRAIPEDEGENEKKLQKCRKELDDITKKIHEEMMGNNDLKQKMFRKMAYYYEKIISSPEKIEKAQEIDKELLSLFKQKEKAKGNEVKKIEKKIEKKVEEGKNLIEYETLDGEVEISRFEYESFSVGVKIYEKDPKKKNEKEVVKEYEIPEGFMMGIEILFKKNVKPTSMF